MNTDFDTTWAEYEAAETLASSPWASEAEREEAHEEAGRLAGVLRGWESGGGGDK